MTPQERQEFEMIKRQVQDLSDMLLKNKLPSSWDFVQPMLIRTLRLPNLSADPATTVTGELACVSGTLKIYNGSAWTVVGTQT